MKSEGGLSPYERGSACFVLEQCVTSWESRGYGWSPECSATKLSGEKSLYESGDPRVCLENLGLEMVFLLPNPSTQLH